MKKTYFTPDAHKIDFAREEILGSSQNPILSPEENKTPSKPAEEFGDISIF